MIKSVTQNNNKIFKHNLTNERNRKREREREKENNNTQRKEINDRNRDNTQYLIDRKKERKKERTKEGRKEGRK